MKMLYEVAVLTRPTQNEQADGKMEEIILSPTWIITRNEESAKIIAVGMAGKPLDANKIEVLVRPFS